MTEWPEFLLPTCILSNLNHSQSVNVFSVETAGPGKTPQCTEGKLTLTFWNVAWVDCESKMGLASAHIHNWGRPLATTRVESLEPTHEHNWRDWVVLSQLLFEVLHVPQAIVEVVVVLNSNPFVFLGDLFCRHASFANLKKYHSNKCNDEFEMKCILITDSPPVHGFSPRQRCQPLSQSQQESSLAKSLLFGEN